MCLFPKRYPGQVILKSTRLRLAHSRRKSTASSISCADHPPSLPVTTQTERPQEVGLEKVTQPLPIHEPKNLGEFENTSLPPCDVTSEFPQTTSLPAALNPDVISEAPLPPPLPPPPPPLPTKEQSTQCSEKSSGPVKQDSMEKPTLLSTAAPSAHLFDSSQLVSAKKKLKKTGDLEGLQRRRGNSSFLFVDCNSLNMIIWK